MSQPLKAYPWGFGENIIESSEGMDLRDWFAGKAMSRTLAEMGEDDAYPGILAIAGDAYRMADAMMEAREHERCPSCHQAIDPCVCYCGTNKDDHESQREGHLFVALGCDCYRAKQE